MIRNTLLITLAIACFAGCTLAPHYTRPAPPVPAEWPTGAAYQGAADGRTDQAAADIGWREFYADERLQKVIGLALDNNRDLRIATLNVERARALYGIQRAGLLPTLNAVGSGYQERLPADLSTTGSSMIAEEYKVNLGILSWEIDFFGRLRSLKDKALEEYLATEHGQRGAQILLVSAVAGSYLTLAADQENFNLAQSTLTNQQAAYGLIQRRYEVGLTTELDLRRAQTQVDSARGDVALYKRLVALDENALNLLAGVPVPKELLPADLDRVVPLQEISPGLSSEVLLRRPDILSAEHQLKANNANIGAARAAFFPRVSLTTAFGTASSELSGLFKAGSSNWTFAPQIVMPIFDARLWSALETIKVEREIAVAQYEKSIQAAFKEVADALALQGTLGDQMAAQESRVQALADTYRLSEARYTQGVDNYLSVLDAQRSLYAAQQGLITLRLARLNNLVIFYRALGGGR